MSHACVGRRTQLHAHTAPASYMSQCAADMHHKLHTTQLKQSLRRLFHFSCLAASWAAARLAAWSNANGSATPRHAATAPTHAG